MIDRRMMMQATAGFAASAALTPAAAPRTSAAEAAHAPADPPLPPKSAAEARLIWARLVGDLSGRPIFYFTHGSVWGFKPQADDLTLADFARRLYGYGGIAARKMERQADGRILMRHKYWSFYRDPVTDEITDRISNPYTGKIDTAAPLSRPVGATMLDMGPAADGAMPYGMRVRRLGRSAIVETSSFARFKPADISWHKLEGNLEDYVCKAAELDSDAPHVPNHYNQNVIAEWQTWTAMHGTPGHILFKGNGEPLYALDEIPADQIAAIERFFPGSLKEVSGWRR